MNYVHGTLPIVLNIKFAKFAYTPMHFGDALDLQCIQGKPNPFISICVPWDQTKNPMLLN